MHESSRSGSIPFVCRVPYGPFERKSLLLTTGSGILGGLQISSALSFVAKAFTNVDLPTPSNPSTRMMGWGCEFISFPPCSRENPVLGSAGQAPEFYSHVDACGHERRTRDGDLVQLDLFVCIVGPFEPHNACIVVRFGSVFLFHSVHELGLRRRRSCGVSLVHAFSWPSRFTPCGFTIPIPFPVPGLESRL